MTFFFRVIDSSASFPIFYSRYKIIIVGQSVGETKHQPFLRFYFFSFQRRRFVFSQIWFSRIAWAWLARLCCVRHSRPYQHDARAVTFAGSWAASKFLRHWYSGPLLKNLIEQWWHSLSELATVRPRAAWRRWSTGGCIAGAPKCGNPKFAGGAPNSPGTAGGTLGGRRPVGAGAGAGAVEEEPP